MATGLRERKKTAAMQAVQDAALDLSDRHGYDNVTIEEIAAVAAVSPSSVYRYFGTKEQILLWDPYDPDLVRRFTLELREHPPARALQRAVAGAMADVFDRDEERVRRRLHYILTEPALAAAGAGQVADTGRWAAAVLARHAGRSPDDLEVAVVADALVAALAAALRHWHAGAYTTPLADEFARALAVLERGLRLD